MVRELNGKMTTLEGNYIVRGVNDEGTIWSGDYIVRKIYGGGIP